MRKMPINTIVLPLTLFLFSAMMFLSCSDNDEDEYSAVGYDVRTAETLRSGVINLEAEPLSYYLYLKKTGEWKAKLIDSKTDSDVSWCHLSYSEVDDHQCIEIRAGVNDTDHSRSAILTLSDGSHSFQINVVQDYKNYIRPTEKHVDVLNEVGQFTIKLVGTATSIKSVTADADWITFKETYLTNENSENDRSFSHDILFNVSSNIGLGRSSTLTIVGNNNEVTHILVHQWGRALKSEEDIRVDIPGSLSILIGGDARQWANVNTLRLHGRLNDTDMQLLRAMLKPYVKFYKKLQGQRTDASYSGNLNLQHLDLSDCTLVSGGDDYSEGGVAEAGIFDTFVYKGGDNRLSDRAFQITRTPLTTIQLPNNLEHIGMYAFFMCQHLERIEIPASVKTIRDYAYSNCVNVKEIVIPKDSKLEELGYFSFSTGSRVKEVYFPITLKIDEHQMAPFGMIACDHMHVSWSLPPMLNRSRISKYTTLCVPMGSGEAYKAAEGWKNAKEIIEE